MKRKTNKDKERRVGMEFMRPGDMTAVEKQVRYFPVLSAIRCCAAECGTRNLLPTNTADPAAIERLNVHALGDGAGNVLLLAQF
jgi:hypothetical protein